MATNLADLDKYCFCFKKTLKPVLTRSKSCKCFLPNLQIIQKAENLFEGIEKGTNKRTKLLTEDWNRRRNFSNHAHYEYETLSTDERVVTVKKRKYDDTDDAVNCRGKCSYNFDDKDIHEENDALNYNKDNLRTPELQEDVKSEEKEERAQTSNAVINPIIKKIGMSKLINEFRRYVLPKRYLFDLGFPIEIQRNKVVIYCNQFVKYPYHSPCNFSSIHSNNTRYTNLTRNASFYTGENLYYLPKEYFIKQRVTYCQYNNIVDRNCSRCGKIFSLSPLRGCYFSNEPCYYHWGKLNCYFIPNEEHYYYYLYDCCLNGEHTLGCTKADLHVWNGTLPGKINGPLNNFVKTRRQNFYQPDTKIENKILGLDCEMCYTAKGFEVCKVTVVNLFGVKIYNYFVKPENPVIDYNTRFSGVKESDFYDRNCYMIKTLDNVHKDLIEIIKYDTILVGHSLENDLRVLKMIHNTIVDTSLVFPHVLGLPYKRSLKTLVFSNLNRSIQNKCDGHDSHEDAKSCIDLMLWKINEDLH